LTITKNGTKGKNMKGFYNDGNMYGTMVCDTPVPYYNMPVSCGLPNEFGDIPAVNIALPNYLVKGLKVYAIDAGGDSMEDVGIHDGDVLLIEQTTHYNVYDVVVAVIDGEQLLKTYYVDDLGRHWLVPANKKYEPILLTEDMDVTFQGRVLCNLRAPRDTISNVRESISEYLKKTTSAPPAPAVLTERDVEEALKGVAAQVTVARHWLGPCRVLMDREYIPEERYDIFCNLVRKLIPDHKHLPQEAELRRMAVECFSKPFDKWTDEKAPVHGTHYQKYHSAGLAMKAKLP
jgi:hypothetical protein